MYTHKTRCGYVHALYFGSPVFPSPTSPNLFHPLPVTYAIWCVFSIPSSTSLLSSLALQPLSSICYLHVPFLLGICYCILHPIFPPFSLLLSFSPCPPPSCLPPPQVLAQGIYDEFQSMVEMYGPESIGNLMPLVVNVLENLDSALADNQVIMWQSIVCCMYIHIKPHSQTSGHIFHTLCN